MPAAQAGLALDALCSPPTQPLRVFHTSAVLNLDLACAKAPRNEANTSAAHSASATLGFTARDGTFGSFRDISTGGSAVRHRYMLVMTKGGRLVPAI